MTEPEDLEEDLFADLYDNDDNAHATSATASGAPINPFADAPKEFDSSNYGQEPESAYLPEDSGGPEDLAHEANGDNKGGIHRGHDDEDVNMHSEPFGSNIKEDGKMFIGGLNWETTDQSLHDYFSQFGDVQECTVMRDGATGRSRGFGFLTFKDPKTVNTVMVKEHFLDGKIIDPKRAIPRDEQEKTSKIFVGGVSQEASETDFTNFFAQFGRVIDATLMMDKDTGRPRGFGFVTFDSEAAVEKCLDYHPLEILGKPIEVKKAQPRGKMNEEEETPRGGRGRGKFGREDRFANDSNNNNNNQSNQNSQPNQAQNAMMGAGGMTPQMMAQYWQRMQQYFAMMQQQMAATAMGSGMGAMGMGQMNPQMMAQWQQMQQMQKMQGGQSPAAQSPGSGGMGNMQNMNPQMQQQMMNMMNMQSGNMNGMNMGGQSPMAQQSMSATRPGFTAQEQLAFEQQKYEQQQTRVRGGGGGGGSGGSFQGGRGGFSQNNQQSGGGPQSWEGMYDDVPQPNDPNTGGRGSAGVVRNLTPSNGGGPPIKAPRGPTTPQPNAAPANAPTGPKNAGKPGANYRGGRGGGRFHPYGR